MKYLVLMATIACIGFAQDQTVVIEAVPKAITAPVITKPDGTKISLRQKDTLNADFAADLIVKALSVETSNPYSINKGRYYLVHVSTLDPSKTAFSSESWSTYQYGVQHPTFLQHWSDPWTNWFNAKRVFGSPDAAVVYLNWVKASSDSCDIFNQALAQLRVDPSLDTEAETGELSKIPDLSKELQGCTIKAAAVTPVTDKARFIELRSRQIAYNLVYLRLFVRKTSNDVDGFSMIDDESRTGLVLLEDGTVVSQRSSAFLSSISYKIAISKKIPTPLANLRDIVSLSGIAGQGATKTLMIKLVEYKPFAGGKEFTVEHLPSDMVVSALAVDATGGESGQQKELSKNTWDNERRYPIDFSLALPLTSYKEATVDLNNGNITAREVKKQRLAAMIDFSPWWLFDRRAGFETKSIAAQLLPVIMGGIPIAGRPLQHPILAAGIGINKAHLFVGTQFNLKRQPQIAPATGNADSSTVTLPPAPVMQKWGTQLVWGLDFSVQTITSLLKSKK